MKKILLILLSAVLLLSLVSCGETETKEPTAETPSQTESAATEATESTEQKTELSGFCVGYAKTDVTPKYSVPMHGYGICYLRMSNGYLDELYTTAIAMTDPNGETVVMVTTDNCNSRITITEEVRERVTAQTGIPGDHILLQATHTHSGPDITTSDNVASSIQYIEELKDAITKTILEALANRAPAKMYYDSVNLKGYNFERQYFTQNGVDISDNHGDVTTEDPIVRHAHDTWNNDMYIIKFARETDKDIYMVNWRAHATKTGGSEKYDLSADYIAPIRDVLEKELDCDFAFCQGEGGNQNPASRIGAENPNPDYYQYGEEIAAIILDHLKKNEMVELNTDRIITVQETYEIQSNHTTDHLLAQAQTINNYVNSSGDRTGAKTMAKEIGLPSIYACSAVVSRSKLAATFTKEIHATIIGDLCVVHAPLENFDTLGTMTREAAPTKYFFYCGYANEYNMYMPDQEAFQYTCYESDCTNAAPGEGEKLAVHQAEMLQKLWKELGH